MFDLQRFEILCNSRKKIIKQKLKQIQEQRFITVSDVSELNITVDCSAHASGILFSF